MAVDRSANRGTGQTLAELLRRYRLAAGMTQEELAERATLSVRAVSDLERGVNRTARKDTARLLGEALGLAPAARAEFEAVARGRPIGLPTADAKGHNLPVELTRMVDRVDDLATVRGLLSSEEVRLVTLTGPGGVGKTRLAGQVALDSVADFQDGVWFVSLAGIRDPKLVPSAIAQAVGVQEIGERALMERLTDGLGPQQLLLLLDNFEHLLEAAVVVTRLLAACPHVKTLVTSRAPLRVRGEREVAVAPLGLPEAMRVTSVEALVGVPAVDLFVERAAAMRRDWTLTPAEAPVVAQICHRLDGLPLAVELAAARIKLLPPPAILTRLSSRLELLTSGPRDLPPRQRTLRDTIAWSYELLDSQGQQLFRRLAVFAGGCDLQAATAVCGEQPESGGLLDRLAGLVDSSLLRQEPQVDGEPRFVMLETIREYALEQLAAAGEVTDLQRRHAAYFVELAEKADGELLGPAQAAWLALLEGEHDNLRVALASALQVGDTLTAARGCAALWRFWEVRGHLSAGRRWLQQALEQAGRLPASLRGRLLTAAGNLARDQCDLAQASALQTEGLAVYQEAGDRRGMSQALNNLGAIATDAADYEVARARYQASLEMARALDDQPQIALLLNNLGLVGHHQGRSQEAVSLLEASRRLFEEQRDKRGMARALNNLGQVLQARGEYERSVRMDRRALALRLELDDQHGIALSLETIAQLVGLWGDLARTARLLGAADAIRVAIGSPPAPEEAETHERWVTASRAALGDSGFAAAWKEGHAMDPERAAREAGI
jgi:predicted ATPase/DNA-binding XRE family transcriptional regulator